MCIVAALGWFVPRITLIGIWLLTEPNWIGTAIRPWFLGLLGFFLLPYTTLAYVLIDHYAGTVDGVGHMILMVLALGLDLGFWGKSRRKKKDA